MDWPDKYVRAHLAQLNDEAEAEREADAYAGINVANH
jgi:hypothetical protein